MRDTLRDDEQATGNWYDMTREISISFGLHMGSAVNAA